MCAIESCHDAFEFSLHPHIPKIHFNIIPLCLRVSSGPWFQGFPDEVTDSAFPQCGLLVPHI
jgi:hypothetical protein